MPPAKKNLAKLHDLLQSGQSAESVALISSLAPDEALEICKAEVSSGGTCLHLAASKGYLDVIKIIIETVGLDVNTKLTEGHVVSGQTPLHEASTKGDLVVMEYLLDKGANVNAAEQNGQTALHCAITSRNLDALKLLLDRGADINCKDSKGETPIQRSILRSPTEFTLCLIKRGADISVCDAEGQTVLHYAVEWENEDLVKLLVEMGSDVNQQDHEGNTSLHLSRNNDTILQFLLQHGGDPKIRNRHGRPPVEKRLEMQEYDALNAALGKHADVMQQRPQQTPAEITERFAKRTVAGDADVKTLRTGVMAELLGKVAKEEQEEVKVSPLAKAGVLNELKLKTNESNTTHL